LGQVTHGPAPRSLTRVSVVVKNDEVRLLNQEPAENPRS
jgi:hypothetical protein